jgi:hypothetical protein
VQRLAGYQITRIAPTDGCAVIYFSMEHSFMCPYCGEEISMVLDTSVQRQTYVEDCEVCCNPIEINYAIEDDVLTEFNAKKSQ